MTKQVTEYSTAYQHRLFGRWDIMFVIVDNKKMAEFAEDHPEEVSEEEQP